MISKDPSWTDTVSVVIKKQHLHFLRVVRRHKVDRKTLMAFYCSSTESLLTSWVSGYWLLTITIIKPVDINRLRVISCDCKRVWTQTALARACTAAAAS